MSNGDRKVPRTAADAESLLAGAAELAELTARVAMQYYGTALHVDVKEDGSPVTAADRAAESTAREWLARRFPGDAVLGEELGVTGAGARRRWLVDPIDGTKSFVKMVPLWGTLVAVEEGGTVLAGAACFPVVNELVAAARGAGCWHNGSRCRVSEVAELQRATVLTTDDRFPERAGRRAVWGELAARSYVARTWGDCYGYLLVATGRAEAMVDDIVSPWDAACMQPIIEEAGGVFTDWRGIPSPFNGSAVATNSALNGVIRGILSKSESQ